MIAERDEYEMPREGRVYDADGRHLFVLTSALTEEQSSDLRHIFALEVLDDGSLGTVPRWWLCGQLRRVRARLLVVRGEAAL